MSRSQVIAHSLLALNCPFWLKSEIALATQFAPQGSQADQSAAEQRNCGAAIGNAYPSGFNTDVVEVELAETLGKTNTRKGARGGHVKTDWRFCSKCYAMSYDGYPDKGHCAAGGAHLAQGFNFVLPHPR